MNRRAAALLAAGLAASGCKTPDARRERDRADPPKSQPAGRSWLDGPGPRLADVGVPKADSWADARDPGYDLQRDVQTVLAGFVEDPDGRKVPNEFIEVEPTDGGGGSGAPVGGQTGADGYFLIKGLKPNQAYQLTVRTKTAAGRVYVRAGSPAGQRIRLPLIENLSLPAATPTAGPVPDDRPPRDPRPASSPRPEPKPPADPGPAAADVPVRPELSTAGPPGLERPPLANIPPPGVAVPPRRESRSVPAGKGFTLLAPDGDSRELPAGRPVLVEFLTTTCLPCKKAAPVIAGLQRRYGLKGLEVVGVVCDEADAAARQSLAARHQRQGGLNYLLYVEPEDRPGALGKRFGVTAYPTLVLLNAGGAVRWHGHPNEAAELEQAIREVLPK